MRQGWKVVSAILSVAVCAGCSLMRQPVSQFEPYIAVNEPEVYLTHSTEWVFTSIQAKELDAHRAHAGKWLGSERVLFLRLHDGDGKPVAYANVICLGTRLGTMADEMGIAWLHGMPEDSMQVKVITTLNGSGVAWVEIGMGQLVGLDVQVSPAKPVYFD